MSNRRAILFFLVASLLLGMLLVHLESAPRPVSETAAGMLFPFAPDDVTGVEIERTRAGGGVALVRLERDAVGVWRLRVPYRSAVDETAVARLLDAATFARAVDVLSADEVRALGGGAADFGFDPAHLALTLSTPDGVRRRLSFGRKTASGGDVYARFDGAAEVYVVPTNLCAALPATPDVFRRRALVSLARDEIVSAEIRAPGVPFVKVVRTADGWRLSEPVAAPAEAGRVKNLLDRFVAARASAYVWPVEDLVKADPVAYGLDADAGLAVTLRTAADREERVVFGSRVATNGVYALVAGGEAIVVTDAALAESCRGGEAAFRDMRLFPFAPVDVCSVSISAHDVAYSLVREGANAWRLVSPVGAPADGARVDALVRQLVQLRADARCAADAPDAVAVSVGTAQTAGNAARACVSAVLLGGADVFVDLRSKTLLALDPGAVRRLRVVTATGEETALVRDVARDVWSPVAKENAPVHRVAADAVVKMLAALRRVEAVSVETLAAAPADLKRCGLDAPAFTLSVDVDAVDAVRKNVLLGHAAPGGGRYATVGGADAIFIVSRKTVADLTLPLVE